jgi:hypothetical protein
MINTLQLAVIAVVRSFLAGPGAGQSCLPFEPKVVTLSGTLTVRAFPGRPSYEDTLQAMSRSTSGFFGSIERSALSLMRLHGLSTIRKTMFAKSSLQSSATRSCRGFGAW